MKTGATGTDVDMRGRGFAGNRASERIERNFSRLEVTKQPNSFRTVGAHRYVDPTAVIETKFLMQLGFSLGADRKRMVELLFEGRGERLQVFGFPEQPAAFVMLHAAGKGILERYAGRLMDLGRGLLILRQRNHLSHQSSAGVCEIQIRLPHGELFLKRRQR